MKKGILSFTAGVMLLSTLVGAAPKTRLNNGLVVTGNTEMTGDLTVTGTSSTAELVVTGSASVGTTSAADSTAALDIVSTTKGLLPPRMTTAQRDAINTPANGLTVYNTTTGKVNVYNGSAWGEVGGGASSGINYASANSDFEVDTSGYSRYADAAGTSPVDATGGSPNAGFTMERTTSTPLRGIGSGLISKDAADRQGHGVSFDFDIDEADKGHVLYVSYDFVTTATVGDSSDILMYVIPLDGSDTTVRQLSPYTLQATSGKFSGFFQATSDATQYRVAFHVATTNAAAWTFKFDNFVVGPQVAGYGSATTEPQSYTPTFTALGTVSNVSVRYYRTGKYLHVSGYAKAGTPTAVPFKVSLPSGLSIDSDYLSTATNTQRVGTLNRIATGTQIDSIDLILFFDGSDLDELYLSNVSASDQITKRNGSSLFVASDGFTFDFTVPILGWSSNSQMSSGAASSVVSAKYQGSTTSVGTSETVIDFPTKVHDTSGAVTTGASWKFTAKTSGIYDIDGLLLTPSASWTAGHRIRVDLYKNSGTFVNLVGFNRIGVTSSTTYGVNFTGSVELQAGEYIYVTGASSVAFTADSGSWISISLRQGPSNTIVTDTVAARYYSTVAQAVGTTPTIMDYATKDYDYAGSVTTGASWKFTARDSGLYEVNAGVLGANIAGSVNAAHLGLQLYKNGSLYTNLDMKVSETTATTSPLVNGIKKVRLLPGEYIDVRHFRSAGIGAYNTSTDQYFNTIEITRVGNY